MDPDAGEPFVTTRRDSFPEDRGYPSHAPRAHIVERSTNDSRVGDRGPLRQGTGDFEPRRSNKRLRYTIPLRYKRKPAQDEEKGLQNGHATPVRPLSLEREASRGSVPHLQQEFLEIVSTQYAVPDDEGQEVVTLTFKDGVAKAQQEQPRCESRWRHIQSEAMTFRQFINQVMRVRPQENSSSFVAVLLIRRRLQALKMQIWLLSHDA